MSELISWEFQTLFDIAIETSGSVASIFELAADNDLSITSDVVPGSIIEYDESVVFDGNVLNYYQKYRHRSVSGILEEENEGIDFMGIEFDFIVR